MLHSAQNRTTPEVPLLVFGHYSSSQRLSSFHGSSVMILFQKTSHFQTLLWKQICLISLLFNLFYKVLIRIYHSVYIAFWGYFNEYNNMI